MPEEQNFSKEFPEQESTNTEEANENIVQTQAIESINQEAVNSNQQSENMEVHHHPHVHHGKKWKDYFYEFLMLFLAVTLGFFVENLREHYVESQREKEYINSFIEDLKTDTLSASNWINILEERHLMLDSLIYFLSFQGLSTSKNNDIYYYARFTTKTNFFRPNDRTITQLKNSGGLRLIRNQQSSDSIMSYEQLLEGLQINREIEERETAFLYPYLAKLFEPNIFETMVDKFGNINRPVNNPPLRTTDQQQIKEFLFYLHEKKTSYIFAIAFLKDVHIKAGNIMRFLQQEYH
jgi:hypothetical protein